VERDFRILYRRNNLDVTQAVVAGSANEKNIATQSAPRHSSPDFARRVRVAGRKQDFAKRNGRDMQTEKVLRARPAKRRKVELSAGKQNPAGLLAIDVDADPRIDVLRDQSDPAAAPFLGNRDLALIPGSRNFADPLLAPVRVPIERLRVLLQVIADSRPAT